MNRDPYINKWQMVELLKIGCFGDELAEIIKNTKDKEWHRMLSTALTYVQRVRDQRIEALDNKEKESLYRRYTKTHLLLFSNDERRTGVLDPVETLVVELEDLYDLADKAMQLCKNCAQGDLVKECPTRALYHKLGFVALRTDPAPGECEYRYDNEIRPVTPQNRLLTEDHIV